MLLLLVETIWEGSVSSYLNLNYPLIAVIAVGVISLFAKHVWYKIREIGWPPYTIMVVCAGLAGAAIIWYKTRDIGWLSYVISAVSGGLIVLLSMLIWRGDEDAEQKYDKRAIREAEDSFKRAKREAKQAKHRAIRDAEETMEKAITEAKERNEEQNTQGS